MKLKYIILPIIATSFAISSCNDFLDREPLTDNVNEGFFTEPSQLQAYCNKKYELLPDFKDTNLFTNDQTSDNQAGTDPVDFFLPQRIKVAHSLDGRRRNIKTFDIDLATSKHSRNLVQQTGDIF